MPEFDLDSALEVPGLPGDLATFVATRMHTASIGAAIDDDGMVGESGFVYMNCFYICDPDRQHGGNYWMMLDRDEASGSLEEMELELFRWAQQSGVFDA